MDPSSAAHVYMATMKEPPGPVRATAAPGSIPLPRGRCRRIETRVLADGTPYPGLIGYLQILPMAARWAVGHEGPKRIRGTVDHMPALQGNGMVNRPTSSVANLLCLAEFEYIIIYSYDLQCD
jgi:hypothetical protein